MASSLSNILINILIGAMIIAVIAGLGLIATSELGYRRFIREGRTAQPEDRPNLNEIRRRKQFRDVIRLATLVLIFMLLVVWFTGALEPIPTP